MGVGTGGVDLNLDHPIVAQELMDYGESKVELWEVPAEEMFAKKSQSIEYEDEDFVVLRNHGSGMVTTIRKTERTRPQPRNQAKVCCICQIKAADFMVYPCGHKCGCKECLDKCP